METFDAVIIGAGPNALVNAAYLTRAGWSVAVLDRNDRPGGGLRTDELMRPGFLHDTYAGFLVLYALSKACIDLGGDLAERGLQMVKSSTPAGVSLHDGRAAVLTLDMATNMAAIDALHPGDGAAWAQMLGGLGQYAPQVFGLLAADLTSQGSAATMRQLMESPEGGPTSFAKGFFSTAREVLESTFGGEVWRAFMAPWVLHSGHGPEEANSGFWVKVFGMGAQSAGLPVGVGGAEKLASSLAQLIKDKGGVIYPNTTAKKILVEDGKAVGVLTENGDELRASKAVVATVNPDQLYGKLLEGCDLVPPALKSEAGEFRYGHAVLAVHLALSQKPQWHDPKLNDATYTHVTAGLDGVSRNFNEVTRRLLPADPTIGVGTPSNVDPSRAPEGCATMVLQALDSPFRVVADARDEIAIGNGTWTEDLKNRYADRVVDIVCQHIPNLKDSILDRYVISPLDLQTSNLNWNCGDPYSGSHALSQSYTLRPLPGQNGHRTPVPGLFQIGAATHPGLGLAGASGAIVASMLLGDQSPTS